MEGLMLCEPKNMLRHKLFFSLMVMILVIGVSVAYAMAEPESETDWKWKAIMTVQALVSYIYITGHTTTGKKIDKLFDKLDDLAKAKMDREEHDRICPDMKVK
jgi:uncharacterized alpha/beta hydrolase family protein